LEIFIQNGFFFMSADLPTVSGKLKNKPDIFQLEKRTYSKSLEETSKQD